MNYIQQHDKKLTLSEFNDKYYLISGNVSPWVNEMKVLRLGAKPTDTKMRVEGYLFNKDGKNALQKLTDFVNKANKSVGYFVSSSTNLVDPQGLKYQVMTYNIPKPYVGQRVFWNLNGHKQYYKVIKVDIGLDGFIDFFRIAHTDRGIPIYSGFVINGEWKIKYTPIITYNEFVDGNWITKSYYDEQNAVMQSIYFL